jgi:hypothetical protein
VIRAASPFSVLFPSTIRACCCSTSRWAHSTSSRACACRSSCCGFGRRAASAGQLAVETVGALEEVGAVKAAAALRDANALFPGAPPADRESRYEALQLLGEGGCLGVLDREFYGEKPDVFSRLCAFIEEHESELVEHQEVKVA